MAQWELETEGPGLSAQDTLKELNILSVWIARLSCRVDADGVRKVTVVANSCLCSRNHSCGGRKQQKLRFAQAAGDLEQV